MNQLHDSIVSLVSLMPADKQAIAIDMVDFAESVMGIAASSNTKLENVTKETVALSKTMRFKIQQLTAGIQDLLTSQEFCDKHGTWLLTEYEHQRYLLVCVNRLSVDETLTTLHD